MGNTFRPPSLFATYVPVNVGTLRDVMSARRSGSEKAAVVECEHFVALQCLERSASSISVTATGRRSFSSLAVSRGDFVAESTCRYDPPSSGAKRTYAGPYSGTARRTRDIADSAFAGARRRRSARTCEYPATAGADCAPRVTDGVRCLRANAGYLCIVLVVGVESLLHPAPRTADNPCPRIGFGRDAHRHAVGAPHVGVRTVTRRKKSER